MPEPMLLAWPTLLDAYGIPYEPDDDLHLFKPFVRPPEGIVVHSGDKGEGVGEYITNDPTRYAYHAAWFRWRGLVQIAPLNLRVHHGGAGNDWLSVALSGPWHQDPRRLEELQALLHFCIVARAVYSPHLRYWCRHSDYDADKKDPGPGVTEDQMALAGLVRGLPDGCQPVRR